MTRRDALASAAAAAALPLIAREAGAQVPQPTGTIETSLGKVRASSDGLVSRFLGIPFGADTGPLRFMPPRPAEAWTGVRDCLAFGAQAPQGSIMAVDPATQLAASTSGRKSTVAGALQAIYASAAAGTLPQSEDCLFLNVYTPDASTRKRRPVMVWLHGGGFASGTGGLAAYDGSELARHGDVVVVTINHRLSALGYLYLGGIDSAFAGSANVGQLDQVLALRWVRDNIEAFGGDPHNVTIFGESGGGAKVGTLLGMPAAKGLFHKAIQQSGAVVEVMEPDAATALAERTLARLGIARAEVDKLRTMDAATLIAAATASQSMAPGMFRGALAPVLDGKVIPAHPFSPKATRLTQDVPLIIGTNKDEGTMFFAADPMFGTMTADEARARFATLAGDKAEAAFAHYSSAYAQIAPTYWVTTLMGDRMFRIDSIRQAERKAAQRRAPVYMYRFDWEPPIANKALGAFHGVEVAMVFGRSGTFGRGESGTLAARMLQAWANFAHTGNPSHEGLAWPRYEADRRETLIFDANPHVVRDPDSGARKLWP